MPIYEDVGMARKKTRKNARGPARRTASHKKAPLGVMIWTTLILFILVVFLFNRAGMHEVIDRTELSAILQRSVDHVTGRAPQTPAPPAARAAQPPATTGRNTAPQVVAAPRPAPRQPPRPAAEPTPASAPAAPEAPAPRAPDARQRRLFFAAVNDAGAIKITGVTRIIDASASPLTETLKTLLAGPDPSELDQGLITLIPPAVTLHRVHVSERIAYVDVSESFRFNPLGREGSAAQLQQLVFSATEFPDVEMVQILIDGRRVDFLGPEGAYIGDPLSRAAVAAGPPAP